MDQRAARLDALGPTIFSEMTELARSTNSVNLGQGFPDTSGPDLVVNAARSALASGANQYAPSRGLLELRTAIARHQQRWYALTVDPAHEVLVTNGATEAMALALSALINPGDEVICLDPSYDAYAAQIALAGGTPVHVALDPVTFQVDVSTLERALSRRTRAIIVNSPHNPSGTVMGPEMATAIATAARERDLVVLSDEVYEHLCFDDDHTPIATLPGMAARTITISSAGKTFGVTGWKVGWATGPAVLIESLALAKSYTTFATATPLQAAVAVGLNDDDATTALRDPLRDQRDLLVGALRSLGFCVDTPAATYFAHSDLGPSNHRSGIDFARALPHDAGVVVIPLEAFCAAQTLAVAPELGQRVRWAFCKQPTVLTQAMDQMRDWLDAS